MVPLGQIRQFVAEIAKQFEPQRIILFGSYATGKFTADSDVDLLVVMNCRGNPLEKEFQILQAVHAPFPLDLLVRTSGEMARGAILGDNFIREVMAKGKVLYESAHTPVNQESRGRLSNRAKGSSREEKTKLRRGLLSRTALH